MSDSVEWEIGKLVISGALGGGVAFMLQHILPGHRLEKALHADAEGARRMADDHIPQFGAAADVAAKIEEAISKRQPVSFELITKLPAGWIFTAPSPDLLGHGGWFENAQAQAVIKYLHYWNVIVVQESRYRSSLDEFLKLFSTYEALSDSAVAVLRERICRVRDNAAALVRDARLLRAQAACFLIWGMRALTPNEEMTAEGAHSAGPNVTVRPRTS
jgi:hypothetical protein